MDDANNDSRTTDFLASTLTLLAVSWLVYICRLYTRLYIIHCFFLEDYFITLAMVRLRRLLRVDIPDSLTNRMIGSSDRLRGDGAGADLAWRR